MAEPPNVRCKPVSGFTSYACRYLLARFSLTVCIQAYVIATGAYVSTIAVSQLPLIYAAYRFAAEFHQSHGRVMTISEIWLSAFLATILVASLEVTISIVGSYFFVGPSFFDQDIVYIRNVHLGAFYAAIFAATAFAFVFNVFFFWAGNKTEELKSKRNSGCTQK